MIRHTDSLLFVWRISEIEAKHLGSREIEPEHLFLGLLKSVDVDVSKVLAKINQNSLKQIESDVNLLRALFDEFLVNTTFMRRRLRKRIPPQTSSTGTTSKKLRRSPESRALFSRAEGLSENASNGNVLLVHLMASILELRLPEIEGVLDAANVCPGEFGAYIDGIAKHGRKS